jgi:hypothetical protein
LSSPCEKGALNGNGRFSYADRLADETYTRITQIGHATDFVLKARVKGLSDSMEELELEGSMEELRD